MLILAETEFWPNLLSGCFRRQIPVAVVNARISDRSWPRTGGSMIYGALFSAGSQGCLHRVRRTPSGSEKLAAFPERVSVAGNLKFDVRAAKEAEATRLLEARAPGLRLVVAGSTLEGEESALLEAWPRLLAVDANLALVLAPAIRNASPMSPPCCRTPAFPRSSVHTGVLRPRIRHNQSSPSNRCDPARSSSLTRSANWPLFTLWPPWPL